MNEANSICTGCGVGVPLSEVPGREMSGIPGDGLPGKPVPEVESGLLEERGGG